MKQRDVNYVFWSYKEDTRDRRVFYKSINVKPEFKIYEREPFKHGMPSGRKFTIYCYDGKEFQTWGKFMEYLQENGITLERK